MRKTILLIVLVIITIISGIALGVLVHISSDEKMKKGMIEYINTFNNVKQEENKIYYKNEEKILKVSSKEEKTSPNAEIVFSTYYTKCGHMEVNKQEIEKDDINKSENEIKEKYKDWIVKKFTPSEIQLYKESNTICKNHYIVKEKDGIVTIYVLDENNNETLKEETDISTKYLPEEDKKLLEKGIKVNSYTELQRVLGDYE